MDVTPLIKQGAQIIQSYANGQFRVNGAVYEGAIIVTPSLTTGWNCVAGNQNDGANNLSEEHFQSLLDYADDIDVFLIGTGGRIQFIQPSLKKALANQGLAIECMDTGAACRTYNVLMAEGRRVAAALLPV